MSRFIPGHSLWIAVFSNEDKVNLIVEKIIHRLSSSHEPFFLLLWIPVQSGLYCYNTVYTCCVALCHILEDMNLSAACLFKVAPTPPDCIPWRHTSQSQTGIFWVLEGCKAHSACGNISPEVLAATAQLAELHRLRSQKLTRTPLLSAVVTTALMLRGMECHKELAQTISLLLAQTVGRHRANENRGKAGCSSAQQQCPYCASSVKKSCYLQGYQNSGPSKIFLDCISSNNTEI